MDTATQYMLAKDLVYVCVRFKCFIEHDVTGTIHDAEAIFV